MRVLNFLKIFPLNPKLTKLLHSLEKTSNEFWNIDPKIGQFINLLIKDRNIKTVFEIGTSNGYSGIWMAEALSHTNGHLTTMESNKARHALAAINFEKSGLAPQITQILGHAPEDIPALPPLDLALFDATKAEHISYFKKIAPHIKPKGLILTDNVISHKTELAPYLKYVKSQTSWKSFEFNVGSGLLFSQKI